ncbi:MAG TPA: formate dehydrogenase accessory sulfurtransferase FdhD [Motiliproteus sp.]
MHSTGYQPLLTQASLNNLHQVAAMDELGQLRQVQIAGESALTIYLDKQEVVTLMTLGVRPEMLVLGYLWNQGLIDRLEQVRSLQVDWSVNAAAVVTHQGVGDISAKLAHRTVTTGCGQGTIFGDLMERIDQIHLPEQVLQQSDLYQLLHNLGQQNEIYRQAGAVHGCALCRGTEVLSFVEDVGRHNAVDTLAGEMLLHGIDGSELIFYTTGRLTSEMVIKVTQMGIPTLLSRSGLTEMGLGLARKVGLTLIGRAKGRHFLVFNNAERIRLDPAHTLKEASHGR